MATIVTGFKELNLSPAHLKTISVAIGPGSYTGTRVGVAAAYGLSFPQKLPLIGFCSLEGFLSEKEGPFASVIDAKSGGTYVMLKKRVANRIEQISPAKLISKELLEGYLQEYPIRVGPHTDYPDVEHLAKLCHQKFENKEYDSELKLHYLRTPNYQQM